MQKNFSIFFSFFFSFFFLSLSLSFLFSLAVLFFSLSVFFISIFSFVFFLSYFWLLFFSLPSFLFIRSTPVDGIAYKLNCCGMFTSNLLDSYLKNTATVRSERSAMVNTFQELYFVIEGYWFTFSVLAMCPPLFQFQTLFFPSLVRSLHNV